MLAAAIWFSATVPAFAETSYTFGVVPQFEPRKLADIWAPILAEITQRTGLKLKMVGSPKIPDFEVSFMAGEFDFAYMNPYHAMLAAREQDYQPLVRDGSRRLQGILTVRKDSPITAIGDLEGKKIAFPAPNALGASLIIRADLATIHNVDILPVYVQTHSSVYLNVVLGTAAAGGGVLASLNQQKQEVRERLRIIYKTRTMAPHPVTAHPRVPTADREKVRQAFLDMGGNESGAALLARIPIHQVVAADRRDYAELAGWGLEKFYVKN